MAESINRYFRLIHTPRRVKAASRLWCPSADVYQTKDGWIVKVELAGVCAEELQIDIQDDTLRITGCRRDTFYDQGVSYHQLEITYSRFEKSLHFPCSIEGATLTRDYLDGILIIQLHCEQKCVEGEL